MTLDKEGIIQYVFANMYDERVWVWLIDILPLVDNDIREGVLELIESMPVDNETYRAACRVYEIPIASGGPIIETDLL